MQVDIKNIQQEKVGTMEVPDVVFSYDWKPELVHQVIVAQDANARNPWAHTKDRSDVRGGGRKPWKQKGTGRARHGSNRSPIWIGGGVTFGPRNEKDFSKKINKKMKSNATLSVLSKKYTDGDIFVIDNLYKGEAENIKTKSLFNDLKTFTEEGKKSLMIILSKKNKENHKFLRNIKNVLYISPESINAKDVLRPKKIIIEKDALLEIVKHYNIV